MKCFAIFVVVAVAAVALASANPVDIQTIESAKTNDATKAQAPEARKAPETADTANLRVKRTLFGGPGGAFRIPFSGDTVPLGGYSSYSSVFNYPYGYASSNPFWPPPTYFFQL